MAQDEVSPDTFVDCCDLVGETTVPKAEELIHAEPELLLSEMVELDGTGNGGLGESLEIVTIDPPWEKRLVSVGRGIVTERDTVAVVIPVTNETLPGLDETDPGREEPCMATDDETTVELPVVLLAHVEEKYDLVLGTLSVSVVDAIEELTEPELALWLFVWVSSAGVLPNDADSRTVVTVS